MNRAFIRARSAAINDPGSGDFSTSRRHYPPGIPEPPNIGRPAFLFLPR